MTMTKDERATMDRLQTELAFRWPTEAEPMPVTRDWIETNKVALTLRDRSVTRARHAAIGYSANPYSGEIGDMWSDGLSHGPNHTGDGASQRMGVMYATRRDAAVAMRWAMCREFANKLRAVDVAICQITQESPS